ncbi:MAG: nucleotidyltransferase domain-containing protein [Thermodesulfovibrionales bacterium]|nr:nucleotidyltransferase domain-containing protein [Thermodesulfovibrionales bacterium]
MLDEFKKQLLSIYGERFSKLVLYGSYARAEAWEGSDIDVAVALKDDVLPAKEIDRLIDIITDINLEYNVLISVYPVSEKSLQIGKSPLLLNIKREGVSV